MHGRRIALHTWCSVSSSRPVDAPVASRHIREGVLMRTLVLNAGYEPLGVVSDHRALLLVLRGRASVLEADATNPICTVRDAMPRPIVILLTRYVRVPMTKMQPVSRRGVLRRDQHRCAYCEGFANTIDHVLPRSRGGGDTWENLVACCLRCNNVKGDKTPQEMGWRLRWEPRVPAAHRMAGAHLERDVPAWAPYLPALAEAA